MELVDDNAVDTERMIAKHITCEQLLNELRNKYRS